MKYTILVMLIAVALIGCGGKVKTTSSSQSEGWHARALPEKQQELMLNRVVELMRESNHWQGYPLESIGFDEARKQWEFIFSDNRPDAGYAVFIEDENATRIEILLFPPVWTQYERQGPSNKTSGGDIH